MRVQLRKRIPGELELSIIFGAITILAISGCRFLPVFELTPSCLFRTYFGLSCPTCGTTRSLARISHGEIAAAFGANPFMTAGILAVLLLCFYHITTLLTGTARIHIELSTRERQRLTIVILMLFLLNWVYLLFFL